MPLARRASVNARVVFRASSMRQALSSAAFSRSSRPMRPSRCDRVTATSGHSSRRIAAASSSQAALSGEKTAAIATERMPGVADPPGRRAHALDVERDERAAVELVAALQHHDLAAHQRGEVLRPVHERRQRGARGQADAHRGDPAEVAPLHHRVGEVGGADHRPRAPRARRAPARTSAARARVMPVVTSGGRGRLHRRRHRVVLEEHRVGVGAAHVDADAPSHANTERKSRS